MNDLRTERGYTTERELNGVRILGSERELNGVYILRNERKLNSVQNFCELVKLSLKMKRAF